MAERRGIDSPGNGALGDLRVLDVTSSVAGAVAAMMLGDHGADVVRLERPDDHGDPGSLAWHRNKTQVAIDLESKPGRMELHRLRDTADVLLVDSTVAQLESLGLDSTTVTASNASCVHVWMPAYGHVGRFSDLPADSLLLAAVSGMADYFCASWDRPVAPVTRTLAYEQGALGATAAMAGIVGRGTHGRASAHVVSGLHAAAALLSANAVHAEGVPIRPTKSAASPLPYYRHYRCRDDRWLYLGSLHQQFFLQALTALDALDIMVMPGVDGDFSRLGLPEIAPAVVARLEKIFATEPQTHWLAVLGDAGVPVAPLETRREWIEGDVATALGLRETIWHTSLGPVSMPAVPISMSSTQGRIRSIPSAEPPVAADSVWREVADQSDQRVPSTGTTDAGHLPLRSLRVLDASTFLAAPLCSAILRQHGADVVKLESLDGDPYRAFSVCWVACNQGKRGIAIDLKKPAGLDLLGRLAQWADVVVDNLRPSARDRLGFADVVARSNAEAIACSVTAYGDSDRWASAPGFDPLIQAQSGLMIAQGGAGPPAFSPMPVHDVVSSTLAAFGVLSALHHRACGGTAQDVTVSLAASSMLVQLGEFVDFAGRPDPQVGGPDWDGPHAGHRLYACANGWVAVAHPDPSGAALLATFGVADDGDCPARTLERAFSATTTEVAGDRLTAAGVTWVPVTSRLDLFDDAWLDQNDVFHRIDDDELGICTVVNSYSSTPHQRPDHGRSAPRLGQHTRAVLAEIGIAGHEFDDLVRSGAVSEPA